MHTENEHATHYTANLNEIQPKVPLLILYASSLFNIIN